MNDSARALEGSSRDTALHETVRETEERTRRLLEACRRRRGEVTVIVVADPDSRPVGSRRYAIADVW